MNMTVSLRRLSCFTVLALSFVYFSCGRQTEDKKPPAEISHAVFDSVFTLIHEGKVSSRQEFEEARNKIAHGLFDMVKTDSLGRADSLVYGQLLFLSLIHI